MLYFLAAALVGTLALGQEPAGTVTSSDLPGSVQVQRPAPPPPTALPTTVPEGEAGSDPEAAPPPPPPPPPEAAPAPAPAEERPSQRDDTRPTSGKRVAAFWMMLPGR